MSSSILHHTSIRHCRPGTSRLTRPASASGYCSTACVATTFGAKSTTTTLAAAASEATTAANREPTSPNAASVADATETAAREGTGGVTSGRYVVARRGRNQAEAKPVCERMSVRRNVLRPMSSHVPLVRAVSNVLSYGHFGCKYSYTVDAPIWRCIWMRILAALCQCCNTALTLVLTN